MYRRHGLMAGNESLASRLKSYDINEKRKQTLLGDSEFRNPDPNSSDRRSFAEQFSDAEYNFLQPDGKNFKDYKSEDEKSKAIEIFKAVGKKRFKKFLEEMADISREQRGYVLSNLLTISSLVSYRIVDSLTEFLSLGASDQNYLLDNSNIFRLSTSTPLKHFKDLVAFTEREGVTKEELMKKVAPFLDLHPNSRVALQKCGLTFHALFAAKASSLAAKASSLAAADDHIHFLTSVNIFCICDIGDNFEAIGFVNQIIYSDNKRELIENLPTLIGLFHHKLIRSIYDFTSRLESHRNDIICDAKTIMSLKEIGEIDTIDDFYAQKEALSEKLSHYDEKLRQLDAIKPWEHVSGRAEILEKSIRVMVDVQGNEGSPLDRLIKAADTLLAMGDNIIYLPQVLSDPEANMKSLDDYANAVANGGTKQQEVCASLSL